MYSNYYHNYPASSKKSSNKKFLNGQPKKPIL